MILFIITPKVVFLLAVLLKVTEDDEVLSGALRAILFISPFYNWIFVILINCQDPEKRTELKKSIGNDFF